MVAAKRVRFIDPAAACAGFRKLSHPYAIAAVDDIVWYNESGKRSDTLVRFDPATERFQNWAIPSEGI